MSKWDDFRKKVGDFADRTVDKTREVTDSAALKIKIANKEADRDVEFKNLGKLAYKKLRSKSGTDQEELTRLISERMEALDRILQELAQLKAMEADRRAEREAEKQARAEEKAKQEDGEQLDMAVMEEFQAARIEADEAYKDAKQAAEEAKNETEAL